MVAPQRLVRVWPLASAADAGAIADFTDVPIVDAGGLATRELLRFADDRGRCGVTP